MKKIIALLLVIVATAMVSSKITAKMQEPILLGDVNRDGKVTTLDLEEIKRYLAGDGKIDKIRADMNSDGEVTLTDLVILKKYVMSGGK